MVGRIVFDGQHDSTSKLYLDFKEFVKKQNLEELIRESAENIKRKSYINVDTETQEFYFKK